MKKNTLTVLFMLSAIAAFAQPKVVAHRGYWRAEGSAQNSITGMRLTDQLGCYGVEFDVWITADGIPVVFHDDTIDGIRIEDTTFATLMNHRLQNGEFIPTLQQFLYESLKYPQTKLIYELKPHRNADRENRLFLLSQKLIHELGLTGRTEYISFSRNACDFIHQQEPDAKVAYLKGDLTPKEVKAKGWTGIDYQDKVLDAHPEWVEEAQKEGLEVNVWTVDGEERLRHFSSMKGVDIITTNDPNILLEILK